MKEVSPEKGLTEAGESEEGSPISDFEAQQITVITLMRIYDMLGMILNHLDPEAADAIAEKHASGGLAGPLPSLNI